MRSSPITILIPCSIIGLLIRIGLETIGKLLSSPLDPSYLAQILGCILVGIFTTWKESEHEHSLLFIGLISGLCGSITSFSTWIVKIVLEFESRRRDISVAAGIYGYLYMSLVGLGLFYASYRLGRIANPPTGFIKKVIERVDRVMSGNDAILALFIVICIVSIVIGSVFQIGILLAIGLGPIGAVLRYFASAKLKNDRFPMGTLCVNLIACIIYSLVLLINFNCSLQYGIIKGFCGCLSTISTFMHELCSMKRFKSSIVYFLLSVIAGSCCVVSVFLVPQYIDPMISLSSCSTK